MTEAQFPWEALFYVQVFVSEGRQLCSLLYPVCQLHHACRVDAEEEVQDFRQLRPGLDSPQVVVLFLCAERALHRGSPHPGKFLSDKVFLLLILARMDFHASQTMSIPILLAVVSKVSFDLKFILTIPNTSAIEE